jgi:hypothetical protein
MLEKAIKLKLLCPSQTELNEEMRKLLREKAKRENNKGWKRERERGREKGKERNIFFKK